MCDVCVPAYAINMYFSNCVYEHLALFSYATSTSYVYMTRKYKVLRKSKYSLFMLKNITLEMTFQLGALTL